MSVTVTNRRGAAVAQYDNAAREGLDAAANLLSRAIVQAHGSWYYKGGAFRDTLKVKASIRHLTPYRNGEGLWETQVGTKIIQALYWELGHRNAFTRKYERVELWAPTAAANVEAMRRAFARVVARLMGRP